MLVKKLLEEYDFTDSIIEKIEFNDIFTDLILTVDYYWGFREEKKEVKIKIYFISYIFIEFNKTEISQTISKRELENIAPSWHTITRFYLKEESQLLRDYDKYKLLHFEIHTLKFDRPWLTILCKDLIFERVL